ncbi:MAG: DnaJ domain-containing protein [Myxococcales bacterium]
MTKFHPAERPAKRMTAPPPMLPGATKPGAKLAPKAAAPAQPARPAAVPPPAPRPVPPRQPAAPARPAPPAAAPAGPPPPPKEEISPEFFAEMEAVAARLDTMDYFELFKLPQNTGIREIKEAYYRESRAYHPDRFAQLTDEALKERINEVFKRVTEAYVVLRDDKKRTKYLGDVTGPERAKKLRYTEASEAEQKAAEKKAIEEQVGTTPKGRECYKNACKEFDAKRYDKAVSQLKMALMYEPANAKYKEKMKEAEKEWDKNRPKNDFRIK